MLFKIRKIGSETESTFGLKTILGLFGDKINDEIIIGGSPYRLSSVVELSPSGQSMLPVLNWTKVGMLVQQPAQRYFSLNVPYSDPEGIFLVVNGLMYDYGQNADFHLTGQGGQTILDWHGGFDLTFTDKLYLKYLTISNPET